MTETHYDVIDEYADEWGFKREFVSALMYPKKERKDMTVFHALAGKTPGYTGRKICTLCDGYLHERACGRYDGWVKDTLHREVIRPYTVRKCPKCDDKIERTQMVEVITDEHWVSEDEMDDGFPDIPEPEAKTQYEPCGHIYEMGEEKVKADIDRDAIREELPDYLLRYDGPVFR